MLFSLLDRRRNSIGESVIALFQASLITLFTFDSDPDLSLLKVDGTSLCFLCGSGEGLKIFNTLASEFALPLEIIGLDGLETHLEKFGPCELGTLSFLSLERFWISSLHMLFLFFVLPRICKDGLLRNADIFLMFE